eukprot:5962680-Pleurochrysis_carterae.AAC.1
MGTTIKLSKVVYNQVRASLPTTTPKLSLARRLKHLKMLSADAQKQTLTTLNARQPIYRCPELIPERAATSRRHYDTATSFHRVSQTYQRRRRTYFDILSTV